MNPSKFNINQYVSQTLDNLDDNKDIFEELEQYFNTGPRRLSFSIPENIKQDFINPVPETKEIQTPRATIEIPEDSTLEYSDDEDFTDYNIKDIQTILKYPKTELLIFYNAPPKNYRRPSTKSIDTRHIWNMAKIPKIAPIQDIEILLLDWAYTYAFLKISGKKIKRITWSSKSNIKCVATWSSFIRWIICASISR